MSACPSPSTSILLAINIYIAKAIGDINTSIKNAPIIFPNVATIIYDQGNPYGNTLLAYDLDLLLLLHMRGMTMKVFS
jgi:hypothetical protein